MSQYSDEELLELSREKAENQLSEEQVKRYNSLKAQQLHEDIDEHKEDKSKENIEGLGELLSDVQDDMVEVVEIAGNELKILVDPNSHDIQRIQKVVKLADKPEDELTEENTENLKEELTRILADFTVDWSFDDWNNEIKRNDLGLRGISKILEPVLETVEDELEQKKRR